MFRAAIISSCVLLTACAGTDNTSVRSDGLTEPNPSTSESTLHNPETSCSLSDQQQRMLDLVNSIRAASQACGSNEMPAVPALSWGCALADAAEVHSLDMAKYGFLDHTGSNGLTLEHRLTAQNYNAGAWAENIAEGYESVEDVVQGFMNSPGHCRNIMSALVTEFGAEAAQSSEGRWYWTQVFATPY